MKSFAALFFFLAAAWAAAFATPSQPPIVWEKVGEDLERATIARTEYLVFQSQVIFLRTSLKRFRLGVVRAAQFGWQKTGVKNLVLKSKAAAGINANFFDEQDNPLGLVISRGILFHPLHRGGDTLTGVFALRRSGFSIVHRKDFQSSLALEAIQAGPLLLRDGTPVAGVAKPEKRSARSGICIDKQQHILLFVATGGIRGYSLGEIQQFLTLPELDCQDALNFDGGGSTQLFVSHDILGAPADQEPLFLPGKDEVPVILALFPR